MFPAPRRPSTRVTARPNYNFCDMVVLASASPRRQELLTAAGIPFEVLPVDVDETPLDGELPEEHVRRLALAKAEAALARRPEAVVLGADTIVVAGGRILGKPRDAEDAARMLRALAGRAHEVLTGVALSSVRGTMFELERTRVWFAPLSDQEIADYVASGEPRDKAGAYAIQGLAARFVVRIDGSYSNVVGLPVALVYRLLKGYPEA
jgi:septum formation protein